MGNQKNKDTLIEMVKLAYKLEGKGKNRKRQLNEILEIIEDKNLYFNFCLCLFKDKSKGKYNTNLDL